MTEPCVKEHEIEKLIEAIDGNGKQGIKVTLALIQQRLDLMPTPNQLKLYMVAGSGLGVVAGYGLKLLFT